MSIGDNWRRALWFDYEDAKYLSNKDKTKAAEARLEIQKLLEPGRDYTDITREEYEKRPELRAAIEKFRDMHRKQCTSVQDVGEIEEDLFPYAEDQI